MAFIVDDDKVEDFLKEKADKDKIKQIYKMAERFEQHHKPKSQTNADRIRAMSDEELAEFLVNFKNTFGKEYEGEMSCLEWLKSEVKE